MGEPENWAGKVAVLALEHDLDEVISGDVPTPAKDQDSFIRHWAGPVTPIMIVKMADMVDAYIFIHEHGMGRHANNVTDYCRDRLNEAMSHCPSSLKAVTNKVIYDLLYKEYTI